MSELSDLKAELEAREKQLVEDFVASAAVQHLLAPLKAEIALLEGVAPAKAEEPAASEEPEGESEDAGEKAEEK